MRAALPPWVFGSFAEKREIMGKGLLRSDLFGVPGARRRATTAELLVPLYVQYSAACLCTDAHGAEGPRENVWESGSLILRLLICPPG